MRFRRHRKAPQGPLTATGPDPLTPERRASVLREHLEAEKSRRRAAEAALAIATEALRRLADPTEIAGFGDATEPHNHTPEMRARLSKAGKALQRVADLTSAGNGDGQ